MSVYTASRYHDISCGHRVFGHESKCANLHGHNYRVTFEVEGELDSLGRVADFSVIKQLLAMWLEDNWDHKFILWEQDPAVPAMQAIDSTLVVTPFNPTAENLAQFILEVVGPAQLAGTGVTLVKVTVEETRKCSATARLG